MSCQKEYLQVAQSMEREGLPSASVPAIQVEAIDWEDRQVLDGGGFALVYQVTPGVAAKVGNVRSDEAMAQRHFAAQGKALPVFDYEESVDLPDDVSQEVCPVHGERADIVPVGADCTCGEPQSILLMPLAEPAWEEANSPEGRAFMEGIIDECDELGRYWDDRSGNLARYQGRLVALDFGESF